MSTVDAMKKYIVVVVYVTVEVRQSRMLVAATRVMSCSQTPHLQKREKPDLTLNERQCS